MKIANDFYGFDNLNKGLSDTAFNLFGLGDTKRWTEWMKNKRPQESKVQRGITGTLSWEIEDGTLTISGTGEMPNYSGTYCPWYSEKFSIKDAVICNGITCIGEFAFYECSRLTWVSIPDSVTSIGNIPFAGCARLTEINVDENNANYASNDGVLFNKAKTTLLKYHVGKTGVYAIPYSVTCIGKGAFSFCKELTTVVIPDSVTNIEDEAFANCQGLTTLCSH